jgi:hypothetical protein
VSFLLERRQGRIEEEELIAAVPAGDVEGGDARKVRERGGEVEEVAAAVAEEGEVDVGDEGTEGGIGKDDVAEEGTGKLAGGSGLRKRMGQSEKRRKGEQRRNGTHLEDERQRQLPQHLVHPT